MGTNGPTPASQHPSSGGNFEVFLQAALTDSYAPLPREIFSPQALVPIDVQDSASTFRQIKFIVDTGASISALPMYIAEQNHIPFSTNKLRKVPILGLGGIVEKSFLNDIVIRIRDKICRIPCLFFDNGTGQGPAILGRAGFLQHFDIQIAGWHILIGKFRAESAE